MVVCTPPPIDESRRLHVTTKIKGMPPELLDRSAAGAVVHLLMLTEYPVHN